MLVALGLIYALLYAAWLRKRRRHGSAAVALASRRRSRGRSARLLERRAGPRRGHLRQHHDRGRAGWSGLTVEGLGNRPGPR